jgi:hypothetical protein
MDMVEMWINVFNDPRVYSVSDLVRRVMSPASGDYRMGALNTLYSWIKDDPQSFSNDELEIVIEGIRTLKVFTGYELYKKTVRFHFERELQERLEGLICPNCGKHYDEGRHDVGYGDDIRCIHDDIRGGWFEDDVPF